MNGYHGIQRLCGLFVRFMEPKHISRRSQMSNIKLGLHSDIQLASFIVWHVLCVYLTQYFLNNVHSF